MAVQLTFRQPVTVPVEVEGITPDVVASLSSGEIEKLPIYVGNVRLPLAEFFEVSVTGESREPIMRWHGDLSGVHWVGAKMRQGIVEVHGNVGRHLGSEIQGGRIVVHGNASDWVGGEARGGFIHVHGNAGHLIGAAYRGSRRGMTGGTILIDGNVGNEIGHTMRRGLLAVAGSAGDLIGFNMLAGTILVGGQVGIRHGAGMKRGTIALLTPEQVAPLPSFSRACRFQPLAMKLILRYVLEAGVPLDVDPAALSFELFSGDMIEGGRGELLLRRDEAGAA